MQSVTKTDAPVYSFVEMVDEGTPVEILVKNVPMSFVEIGDMKCYIETSKLSKAPTNVRSRITELTKKQLGKPYVWGDEGPNSFDCSGLVYYVYKEVMKVTLPRVASAMSKSGVAVKTRKDLRPGDLIFFDTAGEGKITHVGIFISDDTMIHASSSGTIREAKISSSYWAPRILKMQNVVGGK